MGSYDVGIKLPERTREDGLAQWRHPDQPGSLEEGVR